MRPQKRLENKVALISGGDSGIGRAVAYDFAKEGAAVAIIYYDEAEDATQTGNRIQELGGQYMLLKGDLKNTAFAKYCVEETLKNFGKLDILINNHAVQYPQNSIADITPEQLDLTFKTNVFAYFLLIQAALPHLTGGAAIIIPFFYEKWYRRFAADAVATA